MPAPLCFVLMPFGNRTDAAGRVIRFDQLYSEVIQPAIVASGMTPIRPDQELTVGIIHKALYERLLLCDYAVADLTMADANVYYELGIRHALRPRSTVLLFANGSHLPVDAAALRSVSYDLTNTGAPADAAEARADLTRQLQHVQEKKDDDIPLFELITDFPSDIPHLKTNTFQDSEDLTDQEKQVRAAGTTAELEAIEENLGASDGLETRSLVKLFLAYRDQRAWHQMIRLYDAMPEPLRRTIMLREQLGLALNRAGNSEQAEQVLTELLAEHGGSSETYAILGRVYKDRWRNAPNRLAAKDELDRAIAAYQKGFESDWRDTLPGINVVTLMELADPPDPQRFEILPVVRYAARRRIANGDPDYWDYATLFECGVLANDPKEATENLTRALSIVRAKWEPQTTLENLRMIRRARQERGEAEPEWITDVMGALEAAAQ